MIKVAQLKIVTSTSFPGALSIRGKGGKGHPPQFDITNARFEDGDDVVLILKSDFDFLVDRALDDDIPRLR